MMAEPSEQLGAPRNGTAALCPLTPKPPEPTAGLCTQWAARLQLSNKREKPPGDKVLLSIPKSLLGGQGEQGLHAQKHRLRCVTCLV